MKHDIKVLDEGFVRVYDAGVFGDDLAIVNAARVSFGTRKNILDKTDLGLLKYLAKNKHYSPFRHVMIRLHMTCPEPVARQLYKHVVGIETTSAHPTKDHAWNEISGRYKVVDRFHFPLEFRAQSPDNKQASAGLVEDQHRATAVYDKAIAHAETSYKELLALGVAKEQARFVLPFAQYTEFYWTASFQAIANVIELRDHSHAQFEIRPYATALRTILESEFPAAFDAWFNQS